MFLLKRKHWNESVWYVLRLFVVLRDRKVRWEVHERSSSSAGSIWPGNVRNHDAT